MFITIVVVTAFESVPITTFPPIWREIHIELRIQCVMCLRHVWPMPSNESFCIFVDRRIHKPIWFRSGICSFTTQIPNGLDAFFFLFHTLQMAFNMIFMIVS